jgi:hypothetical protein
MPISSPVTVLTGQPQTFGGASTYGSGYIVIANGPVDLVVEYGATTTPTGGISYPAVQPGQYGVAGGTRNGVTGIQAQAAGGVVTSPAQTIQVTLTEPTMPSLLPIGAGVQAAPLPTPSVMQQIAQQQNPFAVAGVTFSSIPQTFTNLKLLIEASSDQATNEALYMTVNGVTAGYAWQTVLGGSTSSSPVAASETAQTAAQIGSIPGGPQTFNHGAIDLTILGYAQPNDCSFTAIGGYNGGASEVSFLYNVIGYLPAGGAVTTLTLTPGAGNFNSYSLFTLYGF